MTKFKKGESGNPTGRPRGAKNKTTLEIKELLIGFVGDNIEDLQSNYDQLEPERKLQFFEKLIKYVVPEKSETEFNNQPNMVLRLGGSKEAV